MLLALIRKELIALSRDVHGLAALFVLPVIFIIVMSMALKDVYSPHVDHLNWAVNNQDQSSISKMLLERWEKENGKPVALPENWQEALRTGQLQYVLQIQTGAGADLAQIQKPKQQRIVILTEPGMDFGVFTAIGAKLQTIVATLRVETLITKLPLQGKINIDDLVSSQIAKTERFHAGPRPTSVQHNVPAWLVFGMFFVVTTIAGLFVEERNCGALSRLHSMGVNPFILLLAKILPFMLINCLQAGLMLAVGVYLIPLIGGDALALHGIDWPALLVMLLAISSAAICLALLVATLVKSQAQASAIGPMMNILMAAIGGIMVPTFVMPAAMQQISQYSPMNWALEGLLDVLLRGGSWHNIQHEVGLLFLFASIAISLAYFRFKSA